MKFTPKTEAEVSAFELFPVGEYDFDVIKAADVVSSKGNEMIKLELDIYAANGNKTRVFDYLLEALAYKLKHFCDCVGLSKAYEEGKLNAEMCMGKAGRCKLGIQKDKNGEYPDKNVVNDYCIEKKPEKNEMNFDINDANIPF